ncbi:MAG: YdcF family protein [Clostridia bacterium]|nr:YdcF family protein [Clostridia bacterium]
MSEKKKIIGTIFRILLICVSFFMIGWYIISAIVTIGSISGIIFFTCTALSGIFSKQFFMLTDKIKSNKIGKIIFRVVTALFAAAMIFVAVELGAMVYGACRTPDENSTLVVLGCQVNGTNPSKMLRIRLETAYDYLVENPDTKCIVSGGKGSNERISEAQCMYNWLTAKGISADRIYMEDKSTNTDENIEFSKQIIEQENLNKSLAIVTDGFHEFRASIIALKHGCSSGAVSAPTPFYLAANFTTRELFAFAAEILL